MGRVTALHSNWPTETGCHFPTRASSWWCAMRCSTASQSRKTCCRKCGVWPRKTERFCCVTCAVPVASLIRCTSAGTDAITPVKCCGFTAIRCARLTPCRSWNSCSGLLRFPERASLSTARPTSASNALPKHPRKLHARAWRIISLSIVEGSFGDAGSLNYHERLIVGLVAAGAVLFHIRQARGDEILRLPAVTVGGGARKAFETEIFARSVSRFGNSVGVEQQAVAGLKARTVYGIPACRKQSQRQSGRLQMRDTIFRSQQDREMARAGDFDFVGTAGASADERGELAGDGALTKHAIGHFEQGVELEPDARERAKHRVQMGHQHRRGDSLAAHVAQQKNQFRILARTLDQVAIVAADDPRRPVKVVHAPIADVDVGWREQSLLHSRRKLQIPLERALLFAGEVIEAQTEEGIGEQAILFDRIVADVAQAVAAAVHAAQRLFDVVQKLEKRRGLGRIVGHGNR